eukprot:4886070-Alexandrium_andersonii.AAC.1
MGASAIGALPGDLVSLGGQEVLFPPRPPAKPIAAILDTGALAADHAKALERFIAEGKLEEPQPPPMAE